MYKVVILFVLCFQLNAYALDSKEKALHLLNRFSYGPKAGEVEKLAKLGKKGLADWLQKQMNPDRSSEDFLNKKLISLRSLKYSSEQMIKAYPKEKKIEKMQLNRDDLEGKPKDILKELIIQKILRASESQNQFEEVLVDFWFNHFNVNFDKGAVKYSVTSFERESIRPYIFGKFQDLLMATAKSPAMLFYLDNHRSRKGQINENYARELLELHTLGVDGGYTQKDIQETARVLTGWGIEKPYEISNFKFFKGQHDTEPKSVLGLSFNDKKEGLKEGERLIAYLAHHKSTAHFIAKKLAVKFISDHPSDKSIEILAGVFLKTDGDLKEVYRALFSLDEFWAEKNISAKIKTPFEYLVSSIRLLNADVIPQIERINALNQFFNQSGEALYRCQPPTGYKATSDFWVNSGAMVNRVNLALKLTRNEVPQIDFDKSKLTDSIKNNKYKDQIELIKYFNQNIFNSAIKAPTLAKLDQFIDDSKNFQEDNRRELPLHYYQIEKILGLMLSTPEFQRR